MCIIIAKTKTQKAPKIDTLKTAYKNNPDGAGFMYVDDNKVVIDKGYMNINSFINRYKYLLKKYNNFKNKNLVIHTRISTSGQVTKEYTHPYVISNNYDDMKKIKTTCNMAIAHNGILKEYTPKDDNTNDTMQFIQKYIYKQYKRHKLFTEHTRNEIEKTGSRFAILTKNDKLHLYGDFIKDNNYYSNDTYKEYSYCYDYSNYDCMIIDDNTLMNIDGYTIDARYLKTRRNSYMIYNYYDMILYEIKNGEIINAIDNIDIEI